MEISKQFAESTVFIECINYNGSGCLVQPNTDQYSYVLTARHCLTGTGKEKQTFDKNNIKILRYKGQDNEKEIKVLAYYLHPDDEIDLAIIKVETVSELIPIRFAKSKFNETIYIWGYPSILEYEDDCNKLDFLEGKIGTVGNLGEKLEFKMEDSNETIDTLKSVNIQGFSGGGIFSKTEEYIILHGIFEGLKDKKGRLGTCLGYGIEEIEKFIDKLDLKPLTNYKLSSFEFYKDKSLGCHCERVRAILGRKSNEILNISPQIISEKMKKKLFIPYKDSDILDDKLWEGWLKILLYLHINNINIQDISKIYYENSSIQEKFNIKILYAPKGQRFKDILRLIFEEVDCYEDLVEGNILVINTKEEVIRDYMYSRKDMNKIVSRISDATILERGLNIDDPRLTRNISGIHINEFSSKLEDIDDMIGIRLPQVENKMRGIVEGVLLNAIEK